MLDMRELDYSNAFDIVLNLFTSFGYFDNLADNRKILAAIHKALVPNGLLVLDYLNPTLTKKQLVAAETPKVGDLQFDITRKIEGGFVVKTIEVQKEGKTEKFREKVRLFDREDFQEFFQAEGFRLEAIWGDYHGTPFAPETSPRMLLFARKLAS
jgi:SAM-dependent methyltransferase